MDLWGWVIVYIVGFSLLQVLIHRYLSEERTSERSTETTDAPIDRTTTLRDPLRAESDPTPADRSRPDPTPLGEALADRRPDSSLSIQRCPRCGASNDRDAAFVYCHRCVKPLG